MSPVDDMDSFTPTPSSVQMSLLRYVREKKRGDYWHRHHPDWMENWLHHRSIRWLDFPFPHVSRRNTPPPVEEYRIQDLCSVEAQADIIRRRPRCERTRPITICPFRHDLLCSDRQSFRRWLVTDPENLDEGNADKLAPLLDRHYVGESLRPFLENKDAVYEIYSAIRLNELDDVETISIMDEAALELEEKNWHKVAAKLVYEALIQLGGRPSRPIRSRPIWESNDIYGRCSGGTDKFWKQYQAGQGQSYYGREEVHEFGENETTRVRNTWSKELEQFAVELRDWQEFRAYQHDARESQSGPADAGADTLLQPQDELLKACRTKLKDWREYRLWHRAAIGALEQKIEMLRQIYGVHLLNLHGGRKWDPKSQFIRYLDALPVLKSRLQWVEEQLEEVLSECSSSLSTTPLSRRRFEESCEADVKRVYQTLRELGGRPTRAIQSVPNTWDSQPADAHLSVLRHWENEYQHIEEELREWKEFLGYYQKLQIVGNENGQAQEQHPAHHLGRSSLWPGRWNEFLDHHQDSQMHENLKVQVRGQPLARGSDALRFWVRLWREFSSQHLQSQADWSTEVQSQKQASAQCLDQSNLWKEYQDFHQVKADSAQRLVRLWHREVVTDLQDLNAALQRAAAVALEAESTAHGQKTPESTKIFYAAGCAVKQSYYGLTVSRARLKEAREHLELTESCLNTVKHQRAVITEEHVVSKKGVSPSETLVILPEVQLEPDQAMLEKCELRRSSELTVPPSHPVSGKRKERPDTGAALEGIHLSKKPKIFNPKSSSHRRLDPHVTKPTSLRVKAPARRSCRLLNLRKPRMEKDASISIVD
ncbi:MAG: hypothetical protein Q9197_002741 [Variospora fuerteventurae]